jgi:hypothetical protein
MSRKSIISISTIAILISVFIAITLVNNRQPSAPVFKAAPQNTSRDTIQIVPNDWQQHTSAKDNEHIVEVTYTQKYGATITLYCMAVFENEKENKYRCIAPWLGTKEIERANANDFQTKIILSSEAPKGATGDQGSL